jgi:hypothetical protein
MKLKIQQVAICPTDPEAAIELLSALGAEEWIRDRVAAKGSVYGEDNLINEAELAFSYAIMPDKEFEVLHYVRGPNWMEDPSSENSVSHFGMHCTEEELEEFRTFFSARGIGVAQEVNTFSHTNPVIAGKRQYHYTIFDTRDILGVDLKFIVRKEMG